MLISKEKCPTRNNPQYSWRQWSPSIAIYFSVKQFNSFNLSLFPQSFLLTFHYLLKILNSLFKIVQTGHGTVIKSQPILNMVGELSLGSLRFCQPFCCGSYHAWHPLVMDLTLVAERAGAGDDSVLSQVTAACPRDRESRRLTQFTSLETHEVVSLLLSKGGLSSEHVDQ